MMFTIVSNRGAMSHFIRSIQNTITQQYMVFSSIVLYLQDIYRQHTTKSSVVITAILVLLIRLNYWYILLFHVKPSRWYSNFSIPFTIPPNGIIIFKILSACGLTKILQKVSVIITRKLIVLYILLSILVVNLSIIF